MNEERKKLFFFGNRKIGSFIFVEIILLTSDAVGCTVPRPVFSVEINVINHL